MRDADRRTFSPRVAEDLGLVDVAADPKDENRGQKADREQYAPGDGFGQEGIERGIDEGRGAPTDRPAGLHDADAAAAVFVANHFAHQDGSGRPLAAEAEAV